MSEFRAGLSVRHALPAAELSRAFAAPSGFAQRDPGAPLRPRHFAPASAGHRATEGWDPLDPSVGETRIDPLEAAHAAGYAEGLAAAAAAQVQAEARDQALLADIVAALGQGLDRAAFATRLRETVLHLVTRLVGEVGVSPDLLTQRVEAATELLADKTESALLRLHPDDVALVEGHLPTTVFAAGDPHVARGSFVLESASTIVEDGPALWLDQLAGAIDKVPVPGC
jgi:flagellar assembly protein FliH